MRILDRYILVSFLVNYLLALGVLIGMYVLLDLIVNFENFTKAAAPTPPVAVSTLHPGADRAATRMPETGPAVGMNVATPPAQRGTNAVDVLSAMTDYYSYQLLVIFQQVSGIIPLLAAGFTMVRMTRHHELTAMLASGVSLYRVAAPIILVSMGFSVLHVLNQEFVISQPAVIEKLLRKHDQVNQVVTRADAVYFVVDSDNSLLSAREYQPGLPGNPPQMKDVFIVQRDRTGMPIGHIYAKTATWELPEQGGGEAAQNEAWVMRGVINESDRADVDPLERTAQNFTAMIYKTGITPAQLDLIFQKKAIDYLSSSQISELAKMPAEVNKPLLYKIMHLRFTQPLMNIIMLLIGIPFLLTREPNRLVVNMFYCLAVTGFVFISTFVIFQMGGTQIKDPMLAAWLPVLIFGPFAVVMMDLIHT